MSGSPLPPYLVMHTHPAPARDRTVEAGAFRFTVITPTLVRIERGAWTDEATLNVVCRDLKCDVPFLVTREEERVKIDTGTLTVTCGLSPDGEEEIVIRRRTAPGFVWHYPEKPLGNLGGTCSTLDNVNGACPLEDGVCSVDGFAFIDDSRTPILRQDGWFSPRQECTDIYFFGCGHDYAGAVRDLMRITGAPGLLPAWALGCWWSRYHAYSDTEYLSLMDRFRREDVPLSVAVVDMDWHVTGGEGRDYFKDGWTGYTWNRELFPDGRAFLSALHERGLKTALNLHPALGVRPWDDRYEEMCRAVGQDPALQKPVPFNCLSPQFLKAYFEVLHFPLEEDGVDFWWLDWQQGNDYRAICRDAWEETGLEDITPLWMLNHMHFLASSRCGRRPMIFSRYAGIGSRRYPIGFSGDTYITWESLRFQPYFTATASNCGYTWWSHDIGGHMGGVRDDEMTVRWIQLGVFSPIFRLHSTDSPFLGREPWNYDRRSEEVIKRFMRLRHRLFPYLYTMNYLTASQCLPLVRPLYHLYPEAAEAFRFPNEYFFGTELLSAPITSKADESGLAQAECWLPEGLWTDAMTGYVYRGGRVITAFRPLEEMPLFMKAGAIVPLQAHRAGSNALGGPGETEVFIAPGASNTFTLYEDDGTGTLWEEGAFALTEMDLEWEDKEARFRVLPVTGDASLAADRTFTLHFRGFAAGTRFTVNSRPVFTRWEEETATHSLPLPVFDKAEGITVTAACPEGLRHQNGDARRRIIDCLMRAQGSQEEKRFFLEKADDALKCLAEGRPLRYDWSGSTVNASLGGRIRELISECVSAP